MAFEIGDRVKLRLSKDTMDRLNLVGAPIDNKIVTIGKVYKLDYAPDQTLYMVDLEEPIKFEETTFDEIYDLRDADLDLIDANEPLPENKVLSFSSFINEAKEPASWYFGIADCHGIESFTKENIDHTYLDQLDRIHDLGLADETAPTRKSVMKEYNGQLSMMMMRCRFNEQRHPVVYRALLTDDDAEMVQDLVDGGDYINALEVIKHNSQEIQLARGQGANLERRWKMIPNPDLDPFHG
jgi:hypothetical protein